MRKKFAIKNPRNPQEHQTLMVVKGDDINADEAFDQFLKYHQGMVTPGGVTREDLVIEDVSNIPVIDGTLSGVLTIESEHHAFRVVQRRNRMVAGPQNGLSARRTLWVVVDGPGDGQFSVMTVEEAIEGEFPYRWVA